VQNELTVGPPTSLSTRANDSFVTSKIKARFVDAQRFNAIHVKVVTENSVAYLMGLVKRQEAKDAVEIARTTQGVKTVVTVFEYLD
jgi:osmotically-inducible protein OsmY